MTYFGMVNDVRYSVNKRQPPAVLRDIAAAPLPRPDLEAEAAASSHRQIGRVVEVERLAREMQELAEGFLANFEFRR